jgi:hypothetical protein
MSDMPEPKVKCTRCGTEILPATAQRNDGLCAPCKRALMVRTLTAEEAAVELKAAAQSLKQRADILRIPTRPIPLDEWKVLEAHLQPFVPQWFRELLAEHSLYGIALEYRDSAQPYIRVFSFPAPDDYNATLPLDSLYTSLLQHGFVPIGYDADGNLWVLEAPFAINSRVFLLELSGWDGGRPDEENGLTFAVSRFALLLCSMGICEMSYEGSPHGITGLMWTEDRQPRFP